jgi:hypothetical protein
MALLKLGFEPLKSDNYIYYNLDTKIIIVTYIDDFLIISRSIPKINQLKVALAKKFSIKELGPAQYFVGVQIVRDRENRKIYLYQDTYIRKILEHFKIDKYKVMDTPIALGNKVHIVPFTEITKKKNVKLYQSIIRSNNYAAIQTRPDIAYDMSILS